MRSHRVPLRRVVFALAGLLLGCGGKTASTLAPGQEGAPGVRKFLVCAPNTVLALPAELQGGTGPLRTEIEGYLRHHGREVEAVDLYEARQAWTSALARAKQAGAIERTPALFAEELSRSRDFDALVMPSLLLHQTRATSSNARWDGVKRRMRVVNAPSLGTGRTQDTFAEGIAYGGIDGETAVTSVHVMVFSRDGQRIFEGRGGLEFIHEIDMAQAKTRHRFELRLRDDLFGDRAVLREGIAVAFDPYLAPPEEP